MTPTENSSATGLQALRQRVDEFVGLFFYGTLLKGVRQHPLTDSRFGFGGRGEEAFGAQLDQELAQRAGRASGRTGLTDAIVRRLSDRLPGAGETGIAALASRPAAAPAVATKDAYPRPARAGRRLDVTH